MSSQIVRDTVLKQYVRKQVTRGERVMGALFPNRGVGWPGGWSQDRMEQVLHLKNWTYVAIHAIAKKFAQLTPNMGFLESRRIPGRTQKFQKAVSVIKPHEDIEPLDSDHPLTRLIENPNSMDTSFDLFYETSLFMELCGVAYWWVIPNAFGEPCEIWTIPSHWVWPRTGGSDLVTPDHPNANRLIQYYEIRPWGGIGSAGILKFPPNEVIMFPWKSPINKIDGYSPLTAAAQWIDSEESITRSRWAQFMNQARPEFHVEMGEQYEDLDDNDIERISAKFMSKYTGDLNFGRPIFTPPGAKVTPLSFNPTEMAYFQSEDQIRDMILSTFSVPKSVVGISNDMTFGSILAAMAGFCTFCINPRLAMVGQRLTKFLAPKFQESRGIERRIKIWYDDSTPADPTQVNADIQADVAQAAITPNEIRSMRGRKGYEHGGDDPMVQGPGGLVPLPLNTGDNLQDLAALVPVLGQTEETPMQQAGQQEEMQNEGIVPAEASVEEPNGVPSGEDAKIGTAPELKHVEKAGFTGKRRDRRGVEICYEGGRRVSCKPDSGDKKKPADKKPAPKKKVTVEQTVASLKKLAADGSPPDAIANAIKTHTVAELKQIQEQLGIKIKGNAAKEARVKEIAKQSIELAKSKPKDDVEDDDQVYLPTEDDDQVYLPSNEGSSESSTGEEKPKNDLTTDSTDANSPEESKPQSTEQAKEDYKKYGTKSKAFKNWFGDWEKDPKKASKVVGKDGSPKETFGDSSQVVDSEGKPIAVVHGTKADFDSFSTDKIGGNDLHAGSGFYFAENRAIADTWAAGDGMMKGKGKVLTMYLNIRKPFDFDAKISPVAADVFVKAAKKLGLKFNESNFRNLVKEEEGGRVQGSGKHEEKMAPGLTGEGLWRALEKSGIKKTEVNKVLEELGFDGLRHSNSDEFGGVRTPGSKKQKNLGYTWVAFRPEQIKSVDNEGTFDSGANFTKGMKWTN